MPSFRRQVNKNRTRVRRSSPTRLTLTVKLIGRLGGTGMSGKNGVIPIIPNPPVFLFRRPEWVGLPKREGGPDPMAQNSDTHHE